jgi:CheY-like chemotaxis protein
MPETDGAELARWIKADPALRDVILISLSSIGDHVTPQMMEQLGFARCLTKPAVPSFLYDSIVDCLAAETPRGRRDDWGIPQPAPAARLDGALCLLAEDNEINQMVAAELLQQSGAVCEIAADGKQAMERALSKKFDFILMDCQMPEMDGFTATQNIREIEKKTGKHIPILALTANAMIQDQERCLQSGMDDYITKPVKRKTLEIALNKWLGL